MTGWEMDASFILKATIVYFLFCPLLKIAMLCLVGDTNDKKYYEVIFWYPLKAIGGEKQSEVRWKKAVLAIITIESRAPLHKTL